LFRSEEDRPRLTPLSFNIHDTCIRIAPDLVVAGFGGSVPAFCAGQQRWDGASCAAIGRGLSRV
jgi:hypothetical protein